MKNGWKLWWVYTNLLWSCSLFDIFNGNKVLWKVGEKLVSPCILKRWSSLMQHTIALYGSKISDMILLLLAVFFFYLTTAVRDLLMQACVVSWLEPIPLSCSQRDPRALPFFFNLVSQKADLIGCYNRLLLSRGYLVVFLGYNPLSEPNITNKVPLCFSNAQQTHPARGGCGHDGCALIVTEALLLSLRAQRFSGSAILPLPVLKMTAIYRYVSVCLRYGSVLDSSWAGLGGTGLISGRRAGLSRLGV